MPALLNNLKNPVFKIYPYTLTYEIFYDEEKAQNIYLPGIEEALNTLPDGYKELVIMRFKDGMSYREIGDTIGRSQERIRQKISKAIRMLRQPFRSFKFIAESREGLYNKLYQRDKDIRILENKNISLLELLNKAGVISQDQIDTCKDDNSNLYESKYTLSIDNLELSIRSYNCLKRAGINTLFDLTLIREEDLCKIRNLGRKSAEEIIAKAKDYGIKLSNEFVENDVRNLDISVRLKVKLMADQICNIEQLEEFTVDDIINKEYGYTDILQLDSALTRVDKSFKPSEEVVKTCLKDDLKHILIDKGYLTINQILLVYYEDWIKILDKNNLDDLNRYMIMRGTPLYHKPDPRYIKTVINQNGENIADLGITKITVDLLLAAEINTIKELISMTFDETYEVLNRMFHTHIYVDCATDINQLMNDLVYRLKERGLNFKFTKDMVRDIKIRDANVSFYTKSLLNSVMIYTIGDLLDYNKIDKLKEREGELHEIDRLIHDANEMLEEAL